ncbi:MAG: hypothetical protein J6D21_01275 [Clostridia bacterium]|nr:hypothetical protein [Clostridia bacterium]
MKTIYRVFKTEEEKKQFVCECESEFYRRLESITHAIAHRDDYFVLALSGPTCAGKTTTAHLLIEDLEACGKNAVVISIDDFFRDHDAKREVKDEPVDYDSIDAIDFPYFAECVKGIYAGETVRLPKYDFDTQKRYTYWEYTRKENDVLIFEGIQAVYAPILALLEAGGCCGIFTGVAEDVCVNGVSFSRHEVRLARRLVRDYKFRSASPDFTFYLWDGVRKNEEANIFPNSGHLAYQMDSFLEYELFLLRPYVLSILREVRPESAYYDQARALIEKFEPLPEISYDLVPDTSMYTEFLGKK